MRESPASVGQRLLWLMDHYQGGHRSLTQQVLWRTDGAMRLDLLRDALAGLSERHESMRTRLVERRRQLVQLICPLRAPEVEVVDLTPHAEPRAALRSALAADLRQRVGADDWPVRTTLFRLGPDELVLCLSLHHLVTDHWSNGLVLRDLRATYPAAVRGGAVDLPPVGWQYATWAEWQRGMLTGASLRRLDAYWRRELDGARLPALPARDCARVVSGSARVDLAEDTVRSLQVLARTLRASLFPVLLTVFYALLHQRTGQPDLTVASLFANRARQEVQQTMGFFVNMVALRARVDCDTAFTTAARQVRDTTIRALQHQDLPFQMLPPGAVRSPSGRSDQMVFQMLDPSTERADMQGTELADLEPQTRNTRFDLELLVVPLRGTMVAQLRYTNRVFDDAAAEAFVRDFRTLADRFAQQPDDSLREAFALLPGGRESHPAGQ